MKTTNRILKYSKKIISIFLLLIELKVAGVVSNSVNSSAVKSYHKIVESFSDFLREEGIDDPQHIFEYFNYALWNGYFSRNHTHSYNMDRKVFWDNAGMSIMSSSGVCLNYADMLSLVFKAMGLNSYVVTCYVEPDNLTVENIRNNQEIIRNIVTNNNSNHTNDTSSNIPDETNEYDIDDKSKFSLGDIFNDLDLFTKVTKPIAIFTGNHAVTCVEYEGELYFFDPTNLAYLMKSSVNDLTIVNGTGKFDLRYFTSIALDNCNLLKIINYKNVSSYPRNVFTKEKLTINKEGLEEFYLNQKENILNVALNNDKNNSLISILIYAKIASFVFYFSIGLYPNIKLKKIEKEDVQYLFPKLKKYFNDNNIKTELAILKNYELIAKELGITDDISKDILRKSLEIFETLIFNDEFKQQLMVLCLNNLGYQAVTKYATKYSNKFCKKRIPLIVYSNGDNDYIYDYETGELLYKDGNIIKSLDNKYTYKISNDENYQVVDKDAILKKMNDENIVLTDEDIEYLRRSKILKKH